MFSLKFILIVGLAICTVRATNNGLCPPTENAYKVFISHVNAAFGGMSEEEIKQLEPTEAAKMWWIMGCNILKEYKMLSNEYIFMEENCLNAVEELFNTTEEMKSAIRYGYKACFRIYSKTQEEVMVMWKCLENVQKILCRVSLQSICQQIHLQQSQLELKLDLPPLSSKDKGAHNEDDNKNNRSEDDDNNNRSDNDKKDQENENNNLLNLGFTDSFPKLFFPPGFQINELTSSPSKCKLSQEYNEHAFQCLLSKRSENSEDQNINAESVRVFFKSIETDEQYKMKLTEDSEKCLDKPEIDNMGKLQCLSKAYKETCKEWPDIQLNVESQKDINYHPKTYGKPENENEGGKNLQNRKSMESSGNEKHRKTKKHHIWIDKANKIKNKNLKKHKGRQQDD